MNKNEIAEIQDVIGMLGDVEHGPTCNVTQKSRYPKNQGFTGHSLE